MPVKTIRCRLCSHAIRGYDFRERMTKLRRHRKEKHPVAHRKSIQKAIETRRKRRRQVMPRKKWGKIGAPKSAKRKTFLSRIRKLIKRGRGKKKKKKTKKVKKDPHCKNPQCGYEYPQPCIRLKLEKED